MLTSFVTGQQQVCSTLLNLNLVKYPPPQLRSYGHSSTSSPAYHCKVADIVLFPFFMALFLTLNCLLLKLIFPVLDDFSIFHMTTRMYLQTSLKFAHIIISHNILALLGFVSDWSLSILFRFATMLKLLILLGGSQKSRPSQFLPLEFGWITNG